MGTPCKSIFLLSIFSYINYILLQDELQYKTDLATKTLFFKKNGITIYKKIFVDNIIK